MFNYIQTEKAANLFAGIGAIATAIAVIIALSQVILEVQRRKKSKQRYQAEKISAWLIRDIGPHSRIAISNLSEAPVYNVVFTIVDGRNIDNDGRTMPAEIREYAVIAPPGRSYISAKGGYGAAGFLPTIEIGYQDTNGVAWIRKSNGDLKKLEGRVEKYYSLSLPVSWQDPQETNNTSKDANTSEQIK